MPQSTFAFHYSEDLDWTAIHIARYVLVIC